MSSSAGPVPETAVNPAAVPHKSAKLHTSVGRDGWIKGASHVDLYDKKQYVDTFTDFVSTHVTTD